MGECEIGIDDPRAVDVQILLETHLAFANEPSRNSACMTLELGGVGSASTVPNYSS